MLTDSGHLTYCTNIHAGESWPDHFTALKQFFPVIKERVSPLKPMGLGLRLSHAASLDLIRSTDLEVFKKWLEDQNAYVFTMNGFPYGGFHNTRVKDDVHSPDWTSNERLEYSIRLFDILKQLLPEGMDGGVSTSPLSYRYWFSESPDALERAKEKATRNIIKVAEHLISIRKQTSQILHLDIEPEPDGILETGAEFIEWYESYLLLMGKETICAKFSVSAEEAEALLKDHIRLCYDVCHFAIGYEPHQEVINELQDKGLKIGKFQISAALKADIPSGSKDEIIQAFSKFNESTYLHQVVARKEDAELVRYRDLSPALQDISHPGVKEWRAHFHVPVFGQYSSIVQSTQSDIVEVLGIHKKTSVTHHLEVETYTWEVLPESLKLPIEESIIRELEWVKDQL